MIGKDEITCTISKIELISEVFNGLEFTDVTDVLNLRIKEKVKFFDKKSKKIIEGTIYAFGSENKLTRIRSVLMNKQIAVHHDAIIDKSNDFYVSSLEERIESLRKENEDLKKENCQLKMQQSALKEDHETLNHIFAFYDEKRKSRHSFKEIQLDVFIPVFHLILPLILLTASFRFLCFNLNLIISNT